MSPEMKVLGTYTDNPLKMYLYLMDHVFNKPHEIVPAFGSTLEYAGIFQNVCKDDPNFFFQDIYYIVRSNGWIF